MENKKLENFEIQEEIIEQQNTDNNEDEKRFIDSDELEIKDKRDAREFLEYFDN